LLVVNKDKVVLFNVILHEEEHAGKNGLQRLCATEEKSHSEINTRLSLSFSKVEGHIIHKLLLVEHISLLRIVNLSFEPS
jgi:hypothetical protein